MSERPEFLTAEELVERWRGLVGIRTLERWRTGRDKAGPAFVRLYAGGPVLYPLDKVIAFEEINLYLTTREPHPKRRKE